LRLTIPPNCPESLTLLIKATWSQEIQTRPSCKDILASLENIQKEYEANKEMWNNLIEPPK